MRTFEARCMLKSADNSPYSQSKKTSEKKEDESAPEHEKRCWRERCHYRKDGSIYIPPMQFANSLKEAAKYASIKVPGKGQATYTKHFVSGCMVMQPLELGVNVKDVEGETFFVPSDGKPGGGSRVSKTFPVIREWEGEVVYTIIDPTINQQIFERVLQISGNLIGIGRFRPSNRGFYGRFICKKVEWIENEI